MSVSCSIKRAVCSVCGKEQCQHEKGKVYGGKTAHRVLLNPLDAYECSFVAMPAQRGARVKSYRQEPSILQSAIRHYGRDHQLLKAMEELSELQKELAKFLGGGRNFDRIAEETADVGIMLDQLGLIFENREMVEDWREKKLERLERRMREEAPGRRCEPSNPPLTFDELREMDGEPVWVCDCDQSYGGYMLVSTRCSGCINYDEIAEFNDYGIEWIAYRRRPEEGTNATT